MTSEASLSCRTSARRWSPGVFFSAVLLVGCGPDLPAPPPLPDLNIDPLRVTVSGLSSGAYMAQQLHLAYSDRLAGAALLAGGPYGCAQGELRTALAQCLAPEDNTLPSLAPLLAQVRERAADGRLAALDGLAGDRVWVYRGSADTIVAAQVSAAAADLYDALDSGTEVSRRFDLPYAHLLPTAGVGDDCTKSAPPYLANCSFDAAGAAFQALYQVEQPKVDADGELRAFDQRPYAVDPSDPPGADSGYVYLPQACLGGASCGLHIALHGCEQSAEVIGDLFARRAGFNRWADAANVVVLYPQTRSSLRPLNPKGCWDWWGYSGPQFDTRDGAQMRWIAGMSAALGAPLLD
jgi:hypothetical protein